jgi:hypothetical protein
MNGGALKMEAVTNINKRKNYLFYVFVLIPIMYFLLQFLALTELIGFTGAFDSLHVLNILDYIINYLMYLYLLIPSAIIRLIRGKPLSWMTWILIPLFFVILIPWSVLASMVLEMPIMPFSPFVPLILPAVIASYFILKFPIRERY